MISNLFYLHYIFEYQQDGQDRARYGENLIQELVKELKSKNIMFLHFNQVI